MKWRKNRSRFEIKSPKQERRASREGGDSPIPAHSLPALRRTSFGCREEFATEVREVVTTEQIRTRKIRR